MKEMYSILTWNVILYFGKDAFEFYALMAYGLGFSFLMAEYPHQSKAAL